MSSTSAPAAATDRALTRVIAALALTAFASGASMRISDPLLPQIALDFETSVGAAAAIIPAYAIPYGLMQAFAGLIGDRFGKCHTVVVACAGSALLALMCVFAQSLPQLALARFVCAPAAAIIIPLGMTFVGDMVPYERRQTVLARFIAGNMFGTVAGQMAGGIIGDFFGWRTVFVALALVFALSAAVLLSQMIGNPSTRAATLPGGASAGLIAQYKRLLADRWSRIVLIAVFVEGALFFGGFSYVAADLHTRFGLSFSAVGVVVAAFGIGSVGYAISVHRLVSRFGERGLVIGSGVIVTLGYLTLAGQPVWQAAPVAVTLLGFGYYMMHNTLQTNATQMLPEARGTAVAAFSSALFLGQSAGVSLAAPIVTGAGAVPVFVLAALMWPPLAWWISDRIARR